MTPTEASELYRTARTAAEVIRLLMYRGRTREAGFIHSIEPIAIRDPMRAINIIRGLLTDDEAAIRRRRAKVAERESRGERYDQDVYDIAELTKRIAALSWAASALTRGLALGVSGPAKEADYDIA